MDSFGRRNTFATQLCNKLDKFNPPPFITVENSTSRSSSRSQSLNASLSPANTKVKGRAAAVQLHKLASVTKAQSHKNAVRYFTKEIDLLNGFIERKGTQLRLEKALQLSNQILKVGLRWQSNEFYPQMERFIQSTNQKSKNDKVNRLPSRQWAQWIAYLSLRESALLVKVSAFKLRRPGESAIYIALYIKLECEKAVKYWLGLISSSHHWGDSLVVTGILSRIWHLSKIIYASISNEIYPTLFNLAKTLKPNNAPSWPSEEFQIPQDLKQWLKCDMDLCYSNKETDSVATEEDGSEMKDTPLQTTEIVNEISIINRLTSKMDSRNISFPSEEDLGVVVEVIPCSKGRIRKGKQHKVDKINPNKPLSEYSVLFKNHKKLQKTDFGRKKLYNTVKKYLRSQTNEKVKLKLRNILRSISAAKLSDDFNKVNLLISKFQDYVDRYKE